MTQSFVRSYSNSGIMTALSIRHEQPNSAKTGRVKYLKIQDRHNSGHFACIISAVRKQCKHLWNNPYSIQFGVSGSIYPTVVGYGSAAANTHPKKVRKKTPAI